jgi:hypothetical protein
MREEIRRHIMIELKITKCKDSLLWYASNIGDTFYAYREYDDSYLVRSLSGYSNIIYKCDCEIIKENE